LTQNLWNFKISHVMINWIPFMIDILIKLTELEV